jgi:hypothetical protein
MKAAYRPEFIAAGRMGAACGPRGSPFEERRARHPIPAATPSRTAFRGENTVCSLETGYNLLMILAVFAMRVLEVMFFTGLAGSTVVVIISFIEDGKELFGENETEERPHPNS